MKIDVRKRAADFFKQGYLLRLLVAKNVKNQYYRSFLGVVWTLLNPLLHMLVMVFVFSSIFGRDMQGGLVYPVYIMSGNIIFSLMNGGTHGALTCFVSQSAMLQKTKVAIGIFPTSNVFSAMVSFGFSFAALLLVMIFCLPMGAKFHIEMLMLIVMLPALLLFTLGLSYILAPVYVFFRDMKHIYDVIVTLWRYLTPIFYSISRITNETVLLIMKFNPMLHYVEYFRTTLIGEIPSAMEHLICYGFGVGMLLIGLAVLKITKNKIVSRL